MVVRSRRHGRRLSDLPDGRRIAREARAVRGGGRPHDPGRFPAQGSSHRARPRGDRSLRDELRAGEEARHRTGPLGPRIHQAEHRRQRRLPGGQLELGHRGGLRAQRQLERRSATEDQAHHLAHGALLRQPARPARARRRRHFLRPAEQGFRRAQGRRQARHRVDALQQRHPVHRHEREEPAVRQSQGPAGGRLCDPVPEDHGRGAVRARQAAVRGAGRHADRGRLATGARLQHRYRQGQGVAGRGRLSERLRDDALVRSRIRGRQRAALRADAGKPRPDRHQDDDQQGAGRELAHRAHQEDAAALHQRVLRLARLSGILLHLVLSRQEFDLQHHELPVQGHGRADRRRERSRGDRRQGNLRQGRERLRRSCLRRYSAHPALPTLRQRGHAEEHLRLSILVPPTPRLPRAGEGINN